MIQEEVVLFSNCLRNEGMPVSIRSTTLAFYILDNLRDIMSYEELYHSLKTIYVKDIDDNDKFERAFKKVFTKLDLKPETIEKDNKNSEITVEEVVDDFNQYQPPQENLEELQELYDQMIDNREKSKAKEGQILDGSMILLDSFDPRVFELCRRLSRKIANKRSKRRKKTNSHHINMPKTIRANIKNGGRCVKLIFDKPPMKKTKHIFLCDVSGSCEWTTTWFLLLLYGCKSTFNKVKIFDFDNKLTDVTDLMDFEKFNNIGQVNVAQRERGISCYGQSDMAKSFEEFLNQVELTHRTDVIILTDCRDWKGKRENGMLKSARLIKNMVKKSHRVIIINPEKKIRWNNATSNVQDYEDAGAEIFEASTLDQFEKVISEL